MKRKSSGNANHDVEKNQSEERERPEINIWDAMWGIGVDESDEEELELEEHDEELEEEREENETEDDDDEEKRIRNFWFNW